MNNSFSKWYKKPSKKQLSIVLIIWIICMMLVLVGTTDWFKNAIPYNIILLLVLPSFLVVLNVLINYSKNKKTIEKTDKDVSDF